MGDCYFLSNYTNYRGEILKKENRRDLIISSEELGMIFDNFSDMEVNPLEIEKLKRKLQNMINGSYGIFFYESDLWNKDHLRKQLHKLIDEALDKYASEPL